MWDFDWQTYVGDFFINVFTFRNSNSSENKEISGATTTTNGSCTSSSRSESVSSSIEESLAKRFQLAQNNVAVHSVRFYPIFIRFWLFRKLFKLYVFEFRAIWNRLTAETLFVNKVEMWRKIQILLHHLSNFEFRVLLE